MKKLVFILLLLSSTAFAEGTIDLPEIGSHYPILTFEKNENPQNIMKIYTKLNDDCSFEHEVQNPDLPLVDFYWLMERTRFKPVHPYIKSGIRDSFEIEPNSLKEKSFLLKLADSKKLGPEFKDLQIKVSAYRVGKKCRVDTILSLDQKNHLKLKKVYGESKTILLPPFRKLTRLTVEGTDMKNGKFLKRTLAIE
jgi:hypothetical protein